MLKNKGKKILSMLMACMIGISVASASLVCHAEASGPDLPRYNPPVVHHEPSHQKKHKPAPRFRNHHDDNRSNRSQEDNNGNFTTGAIVGAIAGAVIAKNT